MKREFPGNNPEAAEKPIEKFDRAALVSMLERGEKNLEGKDLKELDLAELDLEGASFRRTDVRGLILYRLEGEQTSETNIRGTDWTDATFADLGPQTVFQYANAEGATFGFSEKLLDRVKRQKDGGTKPTAEDSGGYHNFDGRGGNFRKSRWQNVDFGGGSGYEALFTAADLSETVFEGVNLNGIDLSEAAKLDGIVIKDPLSLDGMRIRAEDAESVARGITLSDGEEAEGFAWLLSEKGAAGALAQLFGVIVLGKRAV